MKLTFFSTKFRRLNNRPNTIIDSDLFTNHAQCSPILTPRHLLNLTIKLYYSYASSINQPVEKSDAPLSSRAHGQARYTCCQTHSRSIPEAGPACSSFVFIWTLFLYGGHFAAHKKKLKNYFSKFRILTNSNHGHYRAQPFKNKLWAIINPVFGKSDFFDLIVIILVYI